MVRAAVVAVLFVALRAPALPGQRLPAAASAAIARPAAAVELSTAPGAANSLRALARRQWVRPVASLIVPGSGQLLGRHDRGLVYLATEVWLVARAAALTREARRERRAFQDLAFRVARAGFTAVRREGSFEYYESMTQYVQSGRFDADPGPGFAPEPDSLTFNGAMWLLARRTFFADPDSLPAPQSASYRAALAFYSTRAVRDDFQWSWRDARLEQDVFRAVIRSSDDAFRAATNYLGALVVNHIGSAIDALITIRVEGRRPAVVPRVAPGVRPGDYRLLWSANF